ncbi:MAG: hypothetical protein P0116_09970 [Candidatus Nitrosocosmicus sp.]|nr:hypothetical protein [Candidatus Nitrosocosmicus sp.]
MTSCFIILILTFCFSICQGIIVSVQDALASSGVSENMVKDHDDSMNMTEGDPIEQLISPITEWLGFFSLGMVAGLFVFKIKPYKRIDNQGNKTRSRNLIIAISILSVSVGHYSYAGS